MDTVSKVVFNANALDYLRRVEETGEELVVTDDDQPVLRIVPIRKRMSAATLFADVPGKVEYYEDLLAATAAEWLRT